MYRIVVATTKARQTAFSGPFVQRGYRWAFADDAGAAVDEILSAPTDVLVVDVACLGAGSPALAGEVRRIEGLEALPVVVVIAQEAAAERLSQCDWDEFVLDPMRGDELALRIEALLARRRGGQGGSLHQFNFGEVMLDFERYEVTRGGQRVHLTYKEHELLRFLVSNPDKPFTREVLLDRVWGGDYIGGIRTVDVHIRRLRAKLGDPTGAIIETVRGVGYRFRKKE